ncbi:hypothetical protein MCEMSEM23_02392 [Rhabdaerophilaceae bacterium]
MKPTSILKTAALAAGFSILLIGMVLAQSATATPPAVAAPGASGPSAPSPAGPNAAQREILQACRADVGSIPAGDQRREAMRKCVEAKRESAGLNQRADRQAERTKAQEERRALMLACRNEVKDQRLTESERRDQIQACVAKKDPAAAKALACNRAAESKNLQRGTEEFRQHMRACVQAG